MSDRSVEGNLICYVLSKVKYKYQTLNVKFYGLIYIYIHIYAFNSKTDVFERGFFFCYVVFIWI